jgi:AcrR family transcriptional regulator
MPSSVQPPPRARRPGRPRVAKSDEGGDVRDRLLDAATELAVEQGFDVSGIREIAARAQVSSGMISYYFGDRQGLYEAMFQRAFDRVGEQVRARMEDPEHEGNDPLDELVRIQVGSIAADPWLPQLIVREVLARAQSRANFAESVGQGPLQLMVRWLEKEQVRGVLQAGFDPRMMAISIVSLSVFPFLMLPIVADEIGIEFDPAFPNRLIEHNQRILAQGLRARTEDE